VDNKDTLDYLSEGANQVTALDEIMEQVQNLERLSAEVENMETRLDELKQQKKRLEEETIPFYMASHGLEELKLSNGKRLSVKEDVYCRLPEDPFKREEVLQWLIANGGGDKITDTAIVEEVTPEVIEVLSTFGLPWSRKRGVNTNSLTAWVREAIGLKKGALARLELSDFPPAMGAYMRKVAKLA
jgi:hypothetical protein